MRDVPNPLVVTESAASLPQNTMPFAQGDEMSGVNFICVIYGCSSRRSKSRVNIRVFHTVYVPDDELWKSVDSGSKCR